uniref:Variant surface glycoprotein 351 n=1 Tax=Trypanosoma brucei TaxID=5691 RepID=M4SWV9_9TRYP|nr:variant surface glycoprotein 351 [Trypanosoma brucei]
MAASLVILGIVAAILTRTTAEGAGAATNVNAAAYAMLCKTLNAIAKPYASPAATGVDDKIEAEVLAFNFSMHHPTAAEELANEQTTERNKLKKTSEAFQVTTDETFDKIKATAQTALRLRKNKHFANLKATPTNQHLMAGVAHIVKQIQETTAAVRAADIITEQASAQKYLNQAIYGADTLNDDIKLTANGGTTRQQSCGQTGNANAQSTAGNSIKHDMMCLCGVAEGGDGTAVCHTFSSPPSTAVTGNNELKTDWLKLKAGCGAMGEQPSPTPQMTASAAEAAATYIAKAGTTDGKISHLLGTYTTTASTGCNGETGANQGTCIYYGKGSGVTLKYTIKWIENMRQAATAMSAAEKIAEKRQRLVEKLQSLNATLAATASAAMRIQPTVNIKINTEKINKEKSTEQMCHELKSPEQCATNDNCKYDKDKAEEPKCVLSEKGKQAVEKANQETGGTDVKTDCSRHQDQKSCEAVNTAGKPATCGWRRSKEGEDDSEKEKAKCRNCSFLLNKKLTLISALFKSLVAF